MRKLLAFAIIGGLAIAGLASGGGPSTPEPEPKAQDFDHYSDGSPIPTLEQMQKTQQCIARFNPKTWADWDLVDQNCGTKR